MLALSGIENDPIRSGMGGAPMIAKQNVRARIMQMIAEADKQIAAERARPAVKAIGEQQSKGYRNYPRPRKTTDVDDAPTHVLHEEDTT